MTDCINCKAPLTETEKFCPSCGHAVNTVNNNLSNEDFQVKMFDTVISSEDHQLEIDKEAFGSTPVIEHEKILRKKLETYRDKLLRLEQSNQSILLRRIYNKWSFDLSKLSIRGSPAEQFVIERAFQKKNAICLIPEYPIVMIRI